MRNLIILFTLCLFTTLNFAQNAPNSINFPDEVNDFEQLKYNNENYGYELTIPSWIEVKDPGIPGAWLGTLPATRGIENSILIKGFEKEDFKSFEDFTRIYITGNEFGRRTLFSDQHVWYGRNDKDFKVVDNGVSSKVFLIFKNKLNYDQFVLLETSKSYLWIHFNATPDTYEINLPKFNEFMQELKIN